MMYREYSQGIIEVITGPMFSGKSEELIKRIKILGYANIKTLVVKPFIDKRWEKKKIISRAGSSIETISVKTIDDIEKAFNKNDYRAVAIDEVQFFSNKIINLIKKIANQGARVIVSGLDMDFVGRPFGSMPHLLAIADLIDKQTAVCQVCGKAATMSFRKVKGKDQIQIGDKEYEPRCRLCHTKGIKKI